MLIAYSVHEVMEKQSLSNTVLGMQNDINLDRENLSSIKIKIGLPCGSNGKESACNAGALGSIPGLGRFSGGEHGNPLQDSCLENPMDRGAWRAEVHGVTKSQTGLRTQHSD